jgi:DNA polymerase-1
MSREKLFLIDGSAIFYRSYFAFIRNPLINSKGENTSATYGFLNTVFKIITDEIPGYLAIIFDTPEPTFRHQVYPEYKATRERMPEEMINSFPRLISALQALQLPILEKSGFEADDLIATLARRYASKELQVLIVSGDKDLAQLVTSDINIYVPAKSAQEPLQILDGKGIKEKYGVWPEQIRDWLALMGDKSDNVPGIPGIGEKTAGTLIEKYKSLENIYRQSATIDRKSVQEKIETHKELAFLSRQLVTLDDKVDLNIDLADLKLKKWDQHQAEILLKDMEFARLLTRAVQAQQLIPGGETQPVQVKSTAKVNYQKINNEQDLEKLTGRWKKIDEFVFDVETDSLDTFVARLAGIAISFSEDEAFYIVLNHPDSKLNEKEVFAKIQPFFTNPQIRKIAQNIKFDTMVLHQHGLGIANLYFDTMLASFLINSSSSQHNLDNLAHEYLDYKMISIEEVIGSGKNQKKMTDLPADSVFEYSCEDADITLKLKNIFAPKLKELQLEKLFYTIEMPLVPVLIDMEEQGVKLDLSLLAAISKKLEQELTGLKKSIYQQAGGEFNINSPQQLGVLLFDKLEIHKLLGMRRPQRTKTGQYATAEQVLERYQKHELPKTILEYRKLYKLKTTYVDALPDLVHPKTGRVHTSYNQAVASTGRLSSVNPNLQNIPIRTEIGREIRKAFIPSSSGSVIMSADYSQIELRIVAHLSGDKNMKKSFLADLDIHAATAAQIFDIPINEVNADHRRKAKEINFGIIYGMSKYGLANRLDISLDEAEKFMINYFATYPSIQEFMRHTIAMASEQGYVTTIMGRIRYMPQIKSTNRQLREFAERTSINTPIQGSAADLIKKAMIDIRAALLAKNLSSRMILQVHDELVFEVPLAEIDMMKVLVKDKMEHAFKLDIPLKVDVGIGANWLEAH